MLSVASVASAGGAANYFAKDDYYVGDGPAELSEWGGKGAEALGLAGPVAPQDSLALRIDTVNLENRLCQI